MLFHKRVAQGPSAAVANKAIFQAGNPVSESILFEASTLNERESQRRSFAYGNTHIGNPRITREMVDEAAEALTDTKRLDFIQENRYHLFADRNEVGESCYEVCDCFHQVIGEGTTVRDAIDNAMVNAR